MSKSIFDFGRSKGEDKKKEKKSAVDSMLEELLKAKSMEMSPLLFGTKQGKSPDFPFYPQQQLQSKNAQMSATQAMYQHQQQQAILDQRAQQYAASIDQKMLEDQMKILQQQMMQAPMTQAPEYASIKNCHCKSGCWDCDGRGVMAIPTIEWDKNR